MKYATCQLVQGGVIRGYIHLIGSVDDNGVLWPLCRKLQVRLCDPTPWTVYLTDRVVNCPQCVTVTSDIPLAIDHTPPPVWTGATP